MEPGFDVGTDKDGFDWSSYMVIKWQLSIMKILLELMKIQMVATTTVHNVHFVKYDVTVSFYDAVSDTIRRRGGDRGIFTEEGVDTVAYFGGNHGFRV